MDIDPEQNTKLAELKAYLRKLGSVAVAFSSGVDSAFLLKVAHDTLGDKAIAITAKSCVFPEREYAEAEAFCQKEGIIQYIYEADEFAIEGFAANPPNRCYLCKKDLLAELSRLLKSMGYGMWQKGPIWMIWGIIALDCRRLQNLE